jgi:hypothetical protein
MRSSQQLALDQGSRANPSSQCHHDEVRFASTGTSIVFAKKR